MTDLATLGVRLDTTEVIAGDEALDNFAAAAGGAEAAVGSLGDAAARMSKEFGDYNAEVESAYGLTTKLTDGERMVIQALEDQINFLTLSREEQAALNAIRLSGTKVDSEARVVIEGLARSYAKLAETQKAAAQQRASTSQQEFSNLLNPKTGKSARDSASVFIEDFERIDTELRRVNENAEREFNRLAEIARDKAAQAGATFAAELNARLVKDGAEKSARESATVFSQELEKIEAIASQRATQIGANFAEELNRRLINDGVRKSAKDSGAVFSEELERIDAIAKQKAAQIGANFGIELNSRLIAGIKKSAKDSAEVFSAEFARVDAIAKARTAQEGQNFQDDLNRRLGVGVAPARSARDSFDFFEENDPALKKKDLRDLIQIMQMSNGPLGAFSRGISNITFGFGRFGVAIIAGVAGFAALAAAAAKAVNTYRLFEDAQIRVSNRLAFTGGASGQNNDSIEQLVQRNARFGQNTTTELRDAAAELLKFRSVSGDTFSQALEVANRFSQTGLMKVTEAARLMGAALKNPVDGVQQLRDAGFSLSPVLEDNIRKLYEQGRLLEAQNTILKAVSEQLGGVTGGQGLSGAWTQVANSSSSFFEKLGGWIADVSGLEGELRRLANVIDAVTGAGERASSSNGWRAFLEGIRLAAGQTQGFAQRLAGEAQRRGQQNQNLTPEQRVDQALRDPAAMRRQIQDATRSFQDFDQQIIRTGRLAKEQQERVDAVTIALREEQRVAGMSAVQQRVDAELRKAGVDAMSAQGREIANLIRGSEGLRFARETSDDLRRRLGEAQAEVRTVNMSAEAAERYRIVQDRLNEAKIRGISVAPSVIAGWEREAAAIAKANQAAREAQLLKDLRFEQAQLGRTDIEQQIAAAQRQAGDVDPNSVSGQLIANQVRYNDELRRSRELVSDFTSAFTSELRAGLQEGENFWQAFGNAGVKALDRIISKLADKFLQDAMMNLFGGFNFFGGSSIGAASGGMGTSAGLSGLYAKGGIFSSGNVVPFARGAAFTNSIVNKPTLFPFANGTGLMGEAGPEAIMPLRRMPNGRLGVETSGNSRNNSVATGGVLEIRLADGLQAEWLEAAGNNTVQIVQANERARNKRYENGAEAA